MVRDEIVVSLAPTQPEKLTIKDVIFQGAGSTIDECGI